LIGANDEQTAGKQNLGENWGTKWTPNVWSGTVQKNWRQ